MFFVSADWAGDYARRMNGIFNGRIFRGSLLILLAGFLGLTACKTTKPETGPLTAEGSKRYVGQTVGKFLKANKIQIEECRMISQRSGVLYAVELPTKRTENNAKIWLMLAPPQLISATERWDLDEVKELGIMDVDDRSRAKR